MSPLTQWLAGLLALSLIANAGLTKLWLNSRDEVATSDLKLAAIQATVNTLNEEISKRDDVVLGRDQALQAEARRVSTLKHKLTKLGDCNDATATPANVEWLHAPVPADVRRLLDDAYAAPAKLPSATGHPATGHPSPTDPQ